ncbi:unnamed protein product [Pleuronectes platessa]|uniref:Protein kinase domain-containing protein n=1 Tax=Pleuronectes platessa TaxID=8262 RepID=A0A9N7Z6C8_PLEPL|nr:unnamed protein product [Pleuronectes platessa]
MPFRFCPQCGTKLQPGFKFCPSCGEQIPCPGDEPGAVSSAASLSSFFNKGDERATSVRKETRDSGTSCEPIESKVSTRPALRKTRNSLQLDNFKDATPPVVPATHPVRDDNAVRLQTSSPKQHKVSFKVNAEVEPTLETSTSTAVKTPRPVRGKAKLSISSPISRSPFKGTGKSKAKKAKHASAVEPLQEGEEVTDTSGKKWKLMKLLSQTPTEIFYDVFQTASQSKESNHILKLGAKDGRLFNEQNFLQRAAKPASVDKWIKQNKMDFLGIPSCVGFGPHADSYRFLIVPNMGQSLQSVIDEDDGLAEKSVLQLACRLLDVLQYIHSNEYVHADINAENIYIRPGQTSQVYLGGYCHAFRYCPGGQHVEYRELSRTPHEGNIEFISLDSHKGAAPSRRSDLQSLGYCMLRWHTGPLPWSDLSQPEQVAPHKQRYMDDVPALLSHCFGRTRVSSAFQSFLTAVMALQSSHCVFSRDIGVQIRPPELFVLASEHLTEPVCRCCSGFC